MSVGKNIITNGLMIFLLSLKCLNIVEGSRAFIENNGYRDVVVAIASHINETQGPQLIQKIQDLFTEASVDLYTATRHRAYFEEVTILVPEEWTEGNYSQSTFENFNVADVRVDDPNPTYGDGPYTLQSLPCGSPGHYIHLTPSYLRNLRGNSTDLFGPPGKTFVHEWAHLRYGIFDEFGYRGNDHFPIFYYDEKQNLVPNACVNEKLHGTYRDIISSDPCNYVGGYPDKNCIFEPNLKKNTANTSLASFHILPTVTVFCDDSTAHKHNPTAPNKHNVLCNGRSTWSVITENEDFQNDRNPPANITNLKPKFNVVIQKRATFCLALDVSSSMSTDRKMDILKDAVSRLILFDIPLGTDLSIVKFHFDSQILAENKIVTNEKRKPLQENIQQKLTIGSATCIECGLRTCQQHMNVGQKSQGGLIVIITDGVENIGKVANVSDVIIKSKIRVMSITIGKVEDNQVGDLAKATGGHAFYVPLTQNEQILSNIFHEIIVQQANDFDVNIKVYEKNFPNIKDREIVDNFTIDSTLGKDVAITVKHSDDIKNIVDVLVFGAVSKRLVDADITLNLIRIVFDSPQPGQYFYTVIRKDEVKANYSISVTSKQKSNEIKPITTRAWVHQVEIPNENPRYIIYAEVKQGNNPVIDAKVTAKIDSSSDKSDYVTLFDYGNGDPDVTQDDGIYSRYFTFDKILSKGRYLVQIHVTSDNSTTVVGTGFIASGSMPMINHYTASLQDETKVKKTGSFERLAFANELQLDMDINGADYPPSRITDLLVVNITAYDNSSSVTLQWTAPGAHLDQGTAQSYELIYSTTWQDVYSTPHENATKQTLDRDPSPSGTIEVVTTNITGLVSGLTYYLGLRTHNYNRKSSEISNIVSAQIIIPKEIEEENQLVPIIVGIVLGVLFLLFILASLVSYFRQKNKF